MPMPWTSAGNARDDLRDRQALRNQERVRARMPRQRRFAERIDDGDMMAGRFERRGDVGRTERRHDADAVGV